MHFTIKDAIGNRYVVDLAKHGNKYTVGVWDKREHKSAEPVETFERHETAEMAFNATCKRYKVEKFIKDVDTTEVYDFINSQY